MVATYVVITLLAGPQLADTLGGEVARTALAAVVTIGALLLLAPAGLRWMATAESLKDPWARRALLWVALCALAACCANGLLWLLGNTDAWGLSASPAASAIADGIAASAGPAAPTLFEGTGAGAAVANPDTLSLPVRAALLLACCFATAVFEEGFFRGIAVPCAARRTQLELEALKSGDIGPVTQETYRQMSEEEQREITNVSYSAAVFSAIFPIGNTVLRMLSRLVMLPFIVAIAYEFNRLVARHDNALTRALTAPGMWFQLFTTNEPDDSMIEVAIEALTLVLPEQEGADRW